MPKVEPLAASDDPRFARLKAAWPAWRYVKQAGGTLLVPKGTDDAQAACGPAVPCPDGLLWHPPLAMPSLYDLAREVMPQPSVRVELRRIGPVSMPLGTGPVYGTGPRRGKPSSAFGRLAFDLYARSVDKSRPWTAEDDRDVERVIFLGFQQGYHLTDELSGELAPYDLDEMDTLLGVIWGSDPKASASDGHTSPPSPQGSSQTPG